MAPSRKSQYSPFRVVIPYPSQAQTVLPIPDSPHHLKRSSPSPNPPKSHPRATSKKNLSPALIPFPSLFLPTSKLSRRDIVGSNNQASGKLQKSLGSGRWGGVEPCWRLMLSSQVSRAKKCRGNLCTGITALIEWKEIDVHLKIILYFTAFINQLEGQLTSSSKKTKINNPSASKYLPKQRNVKCSQFSLIPPLPSAGSTSNPVVSTWPTYDKIRPPQLLYMQ